MKWIFKLKKAVEMLRNQNLEFKLYNQIQSLLSQAVLEVINSLKSSRIKLRKLVAEYRLLSIHEEEATYLKDSWDNVYKSNSPYGTADLEKKYMSKKAAYTFFYILFLVFEGFIYYMVIQFFVPDLGISAQVTTTLRMLAAITSALLCAAGVKFVIERHFLLLEAKYKFEEGVITERHLAKAKHAAIISYIVGFICVGAIICSGIGRSYIVEGSLGSMPAYNAGDAYLQGETDSVMSSYAEVSNAATQKAKPYMTIIAVVFGVISAIMMAWYYYQLQEISPAYYALKKWNAIVSKRDKVYVQMMELTKEMRSEIDEVFQKAWQLVLDSKLIYAKEYDEREAGLKDEYRTKEQPMFIAGHSDYKKYLPVAGIDYDIFRHGFYNDPSIADIYQEMAEAGSCCFEHERFVRTPEAHKSAEDTATSDVANEEKEEETSLPLPAGVTKALN
jgi:hypothetical protein